MKRQAHLAIKESGIMRLLWKSRQEQWVITVFESMSEVVNWCKSYNLEINKINHI